jgi:hypothetical protein
MRLIETAPATVTEELDMDAITASKSAYIITAQLTMVMLFSAFFFMAVSIFLADAFKDFFILTAS